MIEDIIKLIKIVKNIDDKKSVLEFWSKKENIEILKQWLYILKKDELEVFYELFNDYIWELKIEYSLNNNNIGDIY